MTTGIIINMNLLIFPLIIAFIIITVRYFKNRVSIARLICLYGFTIYVHVLIGVTIFPISIDFYDNQLFHNIGDRINLIPFIESIKIPENSEIRGLYISTLIKNFIGNIILFIPMGFLLPLLRRHINKLIKAIHYGACISLIIETTQIVIHLFLSSYNKVFDINDIILNTIGMMLGYIIFKLSKGIIDYSKYGIENGIEKTKIYERKEMIT